MSELESNRFERLARYIPALILAGFLVGGLGLMVQPALAPKAVWFSPIWFYGVFFLVVSLTGLAAWWRGWRSLMLGAIYFMIVDLSLGAISKELNRVGIGENLMPRRTHSMLQAYQYDYHPLLAISPRPGHADAMTRHTAFGTRMVGEANTIARDKPRIVLIGGSSTYDIAVKQGKTWPDVLQLALPGTQIINYGVGGFTSSEHVVQTAYYLNRFAPTCAIYYLGWNDIRNAFIPDLDPAYADFHLKNKLERLLFYRDPSFTAIMRLGLIAARRFTGVDLDLPAKINALPAGKGQDPAFETIYRSNIRSIIALNQARGVKVGFVGQLFSHAILARSKPDSRDPYMPGLAVGSYAPVMDATNAALKDEAGKLGAPVLMPMQDWLPEDGFTDFGHFNEKGSALFAARVTGFVRETCGTP